MSTATEQPQSSVFASTTPSPPTMTSEITTTAPQPTAWKTGAWGSSDCDTKTKKPVFSLKDLEVEEQYNNDLELAAKLQAQEENQHDDATTTATTVVASKKDAEEEDGMKVPPPLTEEEQFLRDMEMAMKLSLSADGADTTEQQVVSEVVDVTAKHPQDTSQDVAIALALQETLDAEHEASIDEWEHHENRKFAGAKIRISMDNYRTYPVDKTPSTYEPTLEEEEEEWNDDLNDGYVFDKKTRAMRDRDGVIVTKHNKDVSGRKNRQKMEATFPVSFNSGDLKGCKKLKNEIKLSNKVYNELKRFADRSSRKGARLHEKKDHSTAMMAMDKATRLLVFKMINRKEIDVVHGVISTGKESVIFHSQRTTEGDEEENSKQEDCVLKVFKTTLTEFTDRQQFLHGDRRYDSRVGKQHARKLVRLWAEKEMANLTRMERAGIPCPHVYGKNQHVLTLSMIGKKGRAAPKLKDVTWQRKNQKHLVSCYEQVCQGMRKMFEECHLVHCDLSEYNILWHHSTAYFIDVGQSVEENHPHALNYLYRDCVNITNFFEKAGCPDVVSPEDLYASVTGKSITPEQGEEALHHIKISAKRKIKNIGEESESSNVVLRQHTLTLEELQHVVDKTSSEDEDDLFDDDDDDNDEDEDDKERC
eukprot:m.16032 g.16032  ORF g.16032 m.16032 type:complete len:647 (-) comp4558_c0_seq1:168-2108(-)